MADTRVELTDSRLLQMMRNPQLTKEFPFLKTARSQLQSKRKSCGRCGRKNRRNTVDLEQVKRTIGQMPGSKKSRLKQLLGAGQVAVRYRKENSNQVVNLRF